MAAVVNELNEDVSLTSSADVRCGPLSPFDGSPKNETSIRCALAELPCRLRRVRHGVADAIHVAEALQRKAFGRLERAHVPAGIDRAEEKQLVPG